MPPPGSGAATPEPGRRTPRRPRPFSQRPHNGTVTGRLGLLAVTAGGASAANWYPSLLAFARRIALGGVPLQLYRSTRDRVISDPVDETVALVRAIRRWNQAAPVEVFCGAWRHRAEMRWTRRLPGALVRLVLLTRSRAIQI